MPRIKTENRLNDIADAALRVFSKLGYKNAQMVDIAREAGVSSGTIYLYVESKEALFWAAFYRSLGLTISPEELKLAPNADLKVMLATTKIRDEYYTALQELAELPVVIGMLWDELSRISRAVRLVETCSRDWPDLAAIFFGEYRSTFISQLAEYLIAAADKGIARPLDYPSISARLIIETIAWFVMHRHGDYDAYQMSESQARAATLDALVHAFQIPIGEPI